MTFAALTIPIPSVQLTLVFVCSVVFCAVLTRFVLIQQRSLGIGMDHPDEHRKKHGRAISRLGGVPIFITLLLGAIYMSTSVRQTERNWWLLMGVNGLMFGIGFLDDLRPLGARVKLCGQIGVACVLYGLGGSIDFVAHPITHQSIPLGMWSPLVTIFWLIALPNVINLIDGMDGLATGFGLFLCLTLAFVGHFSGFPDVVMISTIMAGALAGFLLFNFPPAKIFLGDGGAYLIGFFIATVSLNCARKGYVVSSLLVMMVAMGLPILDTAFAIARRAIRGVPLFRADAEHIHHRLISLGYTKGQALAILYSGCAALSLVGIYLLTQKGHGTVVIMAALAIGVLAAARILGYVRSFRGLRTQLRKAMERRRDLAFAQAYGHVVELEASRAEGAGEFVEVLSRSLKRLGFTLNPDHGRQGGTVVLLDGRQWMVGRTDLDVDEERWRSRLESLVPGLSRAFDRWHSLPGVYVSKSAFGAVDLSIAESGKDQDWCKE